VSLICIEGKIDFSIYQQKYASFNIPDKKCIFLFPGNSTHHLKNTQLFSIKGGGGLALVSERIGAQGYPTLSLPTTSMENWETNLNQQEIVQGAISDLYLAIGAGYHLMLPVRKHVKKYFDKALSFGGNIEPSFWGGIDQHVNKPLADHYTAELNKLFEFLKLTSEERLTEANQESENPFYQAYLIGLQMPGANFNLAADRNQTPKTPRVDPEKKKELPENSPEIELTPIPPKPARIPSSLLTTKDYGFFGRFYQQTAQETVKTDLEKALSLLNDYTQHNSWWGRVIAGYWNRHHVTEVNDIVLSIENNTIQTIPQLLAHLKTISLVNHEGSLAKTIEYITEQNESQLNIR